MVILTVGNDTKLDDLHRVARDTVFSNTRSKRISAQVLVYEGEFRPWFNTSTADGATIVQASREVERLHYGKHSFELFSGIYGASVKPGALRWLTQQDQAWIDFGWIIEPDVVFTGSWQTLFEKYESDSSDLLAFQHNVSVLKQDGMESLAILHVLSRPSKLAKAELLVARVSYLAKLCRRRSGAPLRFYQK